MDELFQFIFLVERAQFPSPCRKARQLSDIFNNVLLFILKIYLISRLNSTIITQSSWWYLLATTVARA